MIENQYKQIAEFYNSNVDKYGYSFKSVEYGHPASQKLKFQAMTGVMPLDGLSVLDVGCGFADLLNFFSAENITVDYTGYDISSGMIKTAREKHPEARLEVRNILENPPDCKFDVALSTGIFYLLQKNAEDIMREMIKIMFNTAKRAVAFTTISAWAKDQEENEFYADPLRTMDFCRTLTPKVVLRHDYHLRDFAIYMYKD